MNIKLSSTVRSNRMAQILNALDANASAGYIEFYTATQPATGGAAITDQTKIGTCTLSKPCGTVSGGVLTLSTVSDDVAADAPGDIAWARFKDGGGTWVMDGDCGAAGSGAMIIFNTVAAVAGGLVQITSGTLIDGNE